MRPVRRRRCLRKILHLTMPFGDNLGIVLDTGSRFTKAGFSNEPFPRATFPTAIGTFRRAGISNGFPEMFFGNEAIEKRGVSNLTWPVRDGHIKDWDDLEKFLHHTFYKELRVPSEQTNVLYSVHPLVHRRDREKLCELLFESFAIRGLNLMKAPALVLHASGRTTGVVYEIGACCSYAAPVFEGFSLKHSTVCSPIHGERLTEYLQKLLSDIGYSFTTPAEQDLLQEIKKTKCFVSHDYEEKTVKKLSSGESQLRYELPDGQHILLGEERYKCTEALFRPSLLGDKPPPSIVDNICASIEMCDIDYRKHFFENIVVSGGSTMFPGFIGRLSTEMTARARKYPGFKAKVAETTSRENSAWLGGSLVASLECLERFWMTNKEYDDIGPDRVNYKFF